MVDICKTGKLQSPINIKSKNSRQCEANCSVTFYYRSSICSIQNNGGNLVLEYDAGSYINYNSLVYELDKISFSLPASNSIDGSNYDAEMFIWHRSVDIGKVLVVSIFIEINEASSLSKSFFDLLSNPLPKKSGQENVYNTPSSWNVFHALPENKAFFLYSGSLPHSPCTENTTWLVMDSPVNMSRSVYTNIKSIIGRNARQLQRLNGRTIYYNPNSNPKNNRNYGSKIRCYTDEELRRKCQCMCKNGQTSQRYAHLNPSTLLFLLIVIILFGLIYMANVNGLFDKPLEKFRAYLHSKPKILEITD